jgi:RNA polymerase sigma factor (sigma-70 family)
MTQPLRSPDPISAALSAAWDRLCEGQPRWQPNLAHFEAHVRDTLQRYGGDDPLDLLSRLALDDLFLVQAGLQGANRAVRMFLRQHGDLIANLTRRTAPCTSVGLDAEADLLSSLFIDRGPDQPHTARLWSYRGLGSIRGWLRVTARRTLIRHASRQQPGTHLPLDEHPSATSNTPVDERLIELDGARRLRPMFVACIDELPAPERALLRKSYRDNLLLREIADELGVDPSTVFRRLGAVRRKLWKRFVRRAMAELGLDAQAIRSHLAPLAAQLDVDDLFAAAIALFFPR